jgi:DNA-binding response OmpR family regulator
VEDEADSAAFFRRSWRARATDRCICATAKRPWNSAEGGDFDLVLLDLMLPGIAAGTVLEHIKSDGKLRYVPVVVLSAISDKASALRALEVGAEDFLTKPVDVETMLSRVG